MSIVTRLVGWVVIAVLMVGSAITAHANPSITLEGAWRHQPWDGRIDICYTIREVETNIYTVVIQQEDANGAKTRLVTFAGAEGLTATNGTWYVTWHALTDCGGDFDYRKVKLSGFLVCGAEWLVVDVSGGPSATKYPYSYYNGISDPATFFNTDEYKTGKIAFRRCDPGIFMMGQPGTAGYHQVTLTREFYIAIFPTTLAQFTNITTTVVNKNGQEVALSSYNDYPWAGPQGPVYSIGKATVERVTAAVESRSGVRFTLPTDAQWEYACRAGYTNDLYTGKSLTAANVSEIAWSTANSGSVRQEVGLLKANDWGLFDMLGDCTEWMLDRYVDYTGDSVVDPYYPITYEVVTTNKGVVTVTTNIATTTVMRGGSYKDAYSLNTSWYRVSHNNDCDATYHGFRLVYPFPDAALELSESEKPGGTIAESDPIGITTYEEGFDEAEVKLLRVRQRYPWNELVDIDYRVKGFAVGRKLWVSVKDGSSNGRRYAARRFLVDPMLDAETYLTPGDHRITWCSTNDGCVVFSRNCTTRLSTFRDGDALWSTPVEATGEYLVVDLTTGEIAHESPTSAIITYRGTEYQTTKLVLRKLAAGSFGMGAAMVDVARNAETEVRHPVKLSHPYYLGLYEVTQAQYQLLMGMNPAANPAGELFPVENISAAQARAFMEALHARTGLAFSLPTEAQWECALRSGSSAPYPNGSMAGSNLGNVCWYAANSEGASHAVGTRSANAWGFWDLAGNVAEWCEDSYVDDLTHHLIDPLVTSGSGEVVRGGAWNSPLEQCRSAARTSGTGANGGIGMRVALTLSE